MFAMLALSMAAAQPASALPANFLANWMGEMMPVIGPLSLLDMALPGTHDSMTFDLSTTVSDGANDLPAWLSWVLHEVAPVIGVAGVGTAVRNQAQTQGLNMTAQLEAGARFIDFRTMYSAAPTSGSFGQHDWYSLHLVESNHKHATPRTERCCPCCPMAADTATR
jgi:hypothetical protein